MPFLKHVIGTAMIVLVHGQHTFWSHCKADTANMFLSCMQG